MYVYRNARTKKIYYVHKGSKIEYKYLITM